jgi:high-affinity nickel permease
MNMEIETRRALAYTSISISGVGLAYDWNFFKMVARIWLKYLIFSFGIIVAMKISAIKAHVVVSSANLSKKSF